MQASTIREELHQLIEEGDEKLLKLMYVLAKEYQEDIEPDDDFTTEDIKAFEERTTNRIAGKSKVYSWEDAKRMITGNPPDNDL